MESPRRTKLVCTLGPSSFSEDVIERLVLQGMDVARLNFSHGTHDSHRQVYERIRSVEARLGRPIAVLQDLQGPKIRLGKLAEEVTVSAGEELILSSDDDFVGSDGRFPTTYPNLAADVRPQEVLLLADGRLSVEVLQVEDRDVRVRVVQGGRLSSNKGINLPDSAISIPSMTDKDVEDLRFGLELGVDWVALSFVRSSQDLHHLRERMRRFGRTVPIISKIEKPEAVQDLEAIVREGDGIMVARGDLGVEMPPEQVPAIQRKAIRLARSHAKVSIVATQMLMSMTEHARPTHAEVSDVAHAVFDGADAVMLSDETASGKYPERAVQTMASLARAAEATEDARAVPDFAPGVRESTAWAISKAAVVTAEETRAAAIVSYTQFGLGPRLMGAWRPPCSILGCATTDEELRRMALYWGVQALCIPAPHSVESLVKAVEDAARKRHLLKDGDRVVITSKMPFVENEMTNMLKIHQL